MSDKAPLRVNQLWDHIQNVVNGLLQDAGLPVPAQLGTPPSPDMGDLGFPCFAYAKALRKAPAAIAQDLAGKLTPDHIIEEIRPVGPYVNLVLRRASVASHVLGHILDQGENWAGGQVDAAERVMLEYSSPNTNKPLHLGHIRNNLLGLSVSRILGYFGYDVKTGNLVNDRGIHICKTMVAYRHWGEEQTPESQGIKGDHFVGDLYVRFDRELKAEFDQWKKDRTGELPSQDVYFNTESPLGEETRDTLVKWEAGDPEVISLWRRMNDWVLSGFAGTYRRMGCTFDYMQFESQTYKLGKQVVQEGLDKGIFKTREDGAVILDLATVGLEGEKVLLRADSTSVYMTQDIGTALARFRELGMDKLIYVVGDEQLYHFNVLFKILALVDPALEGRCEHLSYGMIRLPEGRMKSREGTVVDADALMDELYELALEEIRSRQEDGKAHYADLTEEVIVDRAEKIAQAALKYYIFRFTAKKSFEYNPKASIDFLGQTGPYCLYTYARTRSVLRRALGDNPGFDEGLAARLVSDLEKTLLWQLLDFPKNVGEAARNLDPSRVADYVYNLCKTFNLLFSDRTGHPILTCEDESLKSARLMLVHGTGVTIKAALNLLGIETLEEM